MCLWDLVRVRARPLLPILWEKIEMSGPSDAFQRLNGSTTCPENMLFHVSLDTLRCDR